MSTEKRRGIDVIIPIYNAYDDLQLCIESIQKYVDLSLDRVILINDCSPDERIRPYVDLLTKQDGFEGMHNERNLGFSGSVNRGMSYSDRDVILLNSDTIVTAGWIDKIVRCADSDISIATVTPLSNSATICSIPNYCQDNPIPDGFTIDQYAEVVERASLRQYPEISVAVGFCMFIKRQVIRRIGMFDAETYERGYGEENDFCWLANQLGYIHVLCDDTFIYHKGTISFLSEEKKKLIEAHEQILRERFPKLVRENEIFCALDKNWRIRKNIELYTRANPEKKSILYVLHLDFHEECRSRVGGTQFHVEDLVKSLQSKYNTYVLARDGAYLRLTLYTPHERTEVRFFIGDAKWYTAFHDRRMQEVFACILSAFRIDLVHVHHTDGLSLDIYYEAHRQHIPVAATLHDYYTICPTIKLQDCNGEVCIGKETPEACQTCLWKQRDISPKHTDYILMWRQEHRKALNLCFAVFTPSDAAKEIILSYYPELRGKIKTIEHGLNSINLTRVTMDDIHYTSQVKYYFEHLPVPQKSVYTLSGWTYLEETDSKLNQIYLYIMDETKKLIVKKVQGLHRADVAGENKKYLYSGFSTELPIRELQPGVVTVRIVIESDGQRWTDGSVLRLNNSAPKQRSQLNVAFIGGMSPAKGSRMACKLIQNSSTDISWYIIGGIGDRELELMHRNNLTKTGWYERSELANIMQLYQIDLVCILSPWPETFCYTISEAWMCGVPVLVTDIGAMGERTRRMQGGWVVKPDASYTDILHIIQHLNRTDEEYMRVKKRVEALKIRTVAEMATDYQREYESCGQIEQPIYPILTEGQKKYILGGYLLEKDTGVSIEQNEGKYEMIDRLRSMDAQMQAIQNSLTYKFSLLLSRIKFPFRQRLKGLLLKIYKEFKR